MKKKHNLTGENFTIEKYEKYGMKFYDFYDKISYDLRHDITFLKEVTKIEYCEKYLLKKLSHEFLKGDNILIEFLKENKNCIKHNRIAYHKDENEMLCLSILKIDGTELEYVPTKYKKLRLFCIIALKQNNKSIKFVDESLFEDESFVSEIIKINGTFLQYCPKFKTCEYIVWNAVNNSGIAIVYASIELQQKPNIIKAAAASNEKLLTFIDTKI
jgi:hypothetical protein